MGMLLSTSLCLGVVVDPAASTEYAVVRSQVVVDDSGGIPALCRAANGELLLAHGTVWETVPPGGRVKLYRSQDEGQTWSGPVVIARPKSRDNDSKLVTGKAANDRVFR